MSEREPAPGLLVEGVTVAYGADVALDRFSLQLSQGESVAVLGPSGSGKSTLLRAIAGLEPLQAGRIEAGGRSLAGVPTAQRDIGLMFQDHALFPHLDVAGNVAFGLRMKKWRPDRRRRRVNELLTLVGLDGFHRRAVHELSGGEAQRVALARALAGEPSLLMLDEPFGSLDRLLREELTVELRQLLIRLGLTALHVTHDQTEAFALADRVAVLRDGRLAQVGYPADLWRSPASAFVAEFLGHRNVWPVRVTGLGGVWIGAQEVAGPSELEPGPATLVVPAPALTVADDGPLLVEVVDVVFREGRYRVAATVVGSAGEVDGDAGAGSRAGEGDAGQPVPATFDSDALVAPGERLRLRVDVDAVHRLA